MFEQAITKKSVRAKGKDEYGEIYKLLEKYNIESGQIFGVSNSSLGQVRSLFVRDENLSEPCSRLLTITDSRGYGALSYPESNKYKKAPTFLIGIFFHVSHMDGIETMPLADTKPYTVLKKEIKTRQGYLDDAVTPIKASRHSFIRPVAGYFITPKLLMQQPEGFINQVLGRN